MGSRGKNPCVSVAVARGGNKWSVSVVVRPLSIPGDKVESTTGLITAVRPIMKAWISRSHDALNFRLTQILSGHDCFEQYRCHIGLDMV